MSVSSLSSVSFGRYWRLLSCDRVPSPLLHL
ncbi:hypothetical protein [Brochothrix phage ADU4]|nr:hypothetical protein [Brochothrix phage ADU4]